MLANRLHTETITFLFKSRSEVGAGDSDAAHATLAT